MRALLLVLVLCAATLVPSAVAAPEHCAAGRVHQAGHELVCERTAPTTCRVALSNDTTGPIVDESVGCPDDPCRELAFGSLLRTDCENRSYPLNRTQRSTTVTVQMDTGLDNVPAFALQAKVTRVDSDEGVQASCRVLYDRHDGPGPQSIDFGQPCIYPFLLP